MIHLFYNVEYFVQKLSNVPLSVLTCFGQAVLIKNLTDAALG